LKLATRIAIAILLAAAAGGAFLHFYRPNKPTDVAGRLTVHFTCDSAGRLEPCGCFTGQHGGLTRLRTWLEQCEDSGPVLNLDVGGAIAGTADYDIIQYRYLARAYRSMGFAALNMGGREARLPAQTLASLAAASPVPMVSASLVDVATRKPLLEPYQIVTLGRTHVGILGVVSPRSVPEPGEGVAVLGLSEAVNRHLPALTAKTDLVILLAFATEAEMRLLARDYFEFALIIGGDVPGPTQDIIRENDSLIVFTTNQARTVGTLSATPAAGKRPRLRDATSEVRLLHESIPQHEDLLALAREYRAEVRRTPLVIDDANAIDPNAIPGVVTTATYVGSATCQKCHPHAQQIWQNSAHSHAFATLVKKGADADPHCVACHTIGFGRATGYRRPLGAATLVDVGCESCHGPASEHLAKVVQGKPSTFKFRPLGPGDCISCHHGEFSRPFEWDSFWPTIAHAKEPE